MRVEESYMLKRLFMIMFLSISVSPLAIASSSELTTGEQRKAPPGSFDCSFTNRVKTEEGNSILAKVSKSSSITVKSDRSAKDAR